jgi:hypothetical protein
MDIRFISSLTSEDENRIASALFGALATMLDNLAIPYTLQISASGGEVYKRGGMRPRRSDAFVNRPHARPARRAYAAGAAETERRCAMVGRGRSPVVAAARDPRHASVIGVTDATVQDRLADL